MAKKDRRFWEGFDPPVSHAEGRAEHCSTCGKPSGQPCVTVGGPHPGKEMRLHHQARYAVVRARRNNPTPAGPEFECSRREQPPREKGRNR